MGVVDRIFRPNPQESRGGEVHNVESPSPLGRRGEIMSEARFDIIDQRLERIEVRLDRFDERLDGFDERMARFDERMDRMDMRMDRMESGILALTASMARIEDALPHIATKEDVAQAKLYATKSQRAMVASIVAAGIAVAGGSARLWPA